MNIKNVQLQQQNYLMFPSVGKEDSVKEKIKERNWDDRLGSKGGIPEYSPLKDKHTKNYRRVIGSTKKEEDQSGVKGKKATYFQKRMELIDELSSLHKSNEKLLEQYEEMAGKYKLPNFYIYYSLLPLLNTSNNITQYLFNEKKQMKEQATFYHRISTAVKARQQCLERIRKTLSELREDKIDEKNTQLKEQFQHYRFLTENVIDQIKKWRDSLGKLEERPIFYNDNQQNYLIKLLNDNKFIFNSKLSLALSFAQKNDPFILIPVKRAEGKESSLFSEIVQLPKDASHYQKYMEYLASEKAYELSLNPQQKQVHVYKNPSVEKIYKSNHPVKLQVTTPLKQEPQQDGYKKMQVLKMREERLKKNEERIKSIKSIYETYNKKLEEKNYRSERKMPQTDNEDRRGLKKRSESIKVKHQASESQFEMLVKARVDVQKPPKTPLRKRHDAKSSSKLPKTQDKMIESLKDIQSTLKNKLQILQQEEKVEVSNPSQLNTTQQKFTRKNNEEIIRQLKQQIMSKIEKQSQEKEKIKKMKRQQQEKMLEQIKAKLKKQMQQKLQQKKKEKLLQREELQKKLKEQEERLGNQKQLQLQLQLKLNKQKEMRQLEKIKRQSLEREKKYKEELQKQQSLRRQREEAMDRQRREKQRLMEELKKKEIREQIEEQLRSEIKGNNVQKDKNDEKIEQDYIRNQKQAQLAKELEALKLREGLEMQHLKKENQLRERMLKLKKDEEQLKRKEIEQLMKLAIQSQKQQLQNETIKKRIEIQQNMRSNVKERLLQEYKHQKQGEVEKIKLQREKQLEEQIYREKIRQKIEREMRIQAINRTKKELDERETKKYEIQSKLQQVKNHFDKEVVLDKNKIEQQVKKEMIQKVIFDKQAEKEAAKHDLRMQFEKELFTSAVPQIYQHKESFHVKNINYFEGDVHLNSKLNQNKPTNQKPQQNESPKKGEVKQMIDTMTLQQLQIYEKQKDKVNQMKEEKFVIQSKPRQQQEGFEQVRIDKSKKEDEGYEVRLIKNQSSKKQEKVIKESSKKKKKRKQESDESIDSEDRKKHKKHKKQQKKQYYEEQSQDSEDAKKKKKNKRKRKDSSEEQHVSSEEQKPSKKSPVKTKQQQYKTSQQEKKKNIQEVIPVKQSRALSKQPSQKAVIHFDAQKSKLTHNPIDKITYKPQKIVTNSEKFKISLEAIPQADFDEYLEVHLSRVPQIQLSIQMQSRQDLYRKLIGQLTFCLLVGQYQGRVVGLAIAYHDRSRQDIRKFTIIHMATYKNEDHKDFIISCTNFIFRKDPTDEIEFHYRFNEAEASQLQFSSEFNKWFDKFGSVFQKKSQENVFERKYVFKRQFNQKCQVVLGGINKNTFRNLFSVYCGVLMSDSDMLQYKEELIDTLAPQNQICYSIMVSELFRTYLSPDEAEALKNKVKQFVKLKEMLVLVVMMQKKKVKLEELKLYEYKNLIQLNMRLMSQGKEIIRYCKDGNAQLNRLYYAQLNHAFNLPFHFQTTSLPVESKDNEIRQISYFRLSSLPPFKLHIIKSSLYNAEMNILPTENSKYKIFVINAQEYNEIKEANHIDLFMYIRLFLKNVKSHNVAVWKYVWLPEMTDKGAWNLREYRSFLNKDFYTHDSINISYRQFLPGALIIEPEHRDLVITPPFIVGVMSMSLEQVSQGSPIYARMIELDALKTLQVERIEAQQ